MNYCAFDIETAKPTPLGMKNWNTSRPLGISCAATFLDNLDVELWFSKSNEKIEKRMTKKDLSIMVKKLHEKVENGITLVTWNGLGFDFDVLSEESGLYDECKWLALNHVDVMFYFFCITGYPVGLDSVAKGMKIPGKPEGMHGGLAPQYWMEGKYETVLNYVTQDVRATLMIANQIEITGEIKWISKDGKLKTMSLPIPMLTVKDAMTLNEPDTSWMQNPWRRSKFTEWLYKI